MVSGKNFLISKENTFSKNEYFNICMVGFIEVMHFFLLEPRLEDRGWDLTENLSAL